MTNEDCGIILKMSFRVLRWRRCHAVTEVEIVGIVPRAVRNSTHSGNAPYCNNTSTPLIPRQRGTGNERTSE